MLDEPATVALSSSSNNDGGSSDGAARPDSAMGVGQGRILTTHVKPFSTVGVGVAISTLGIGFQIATPVAQRLNIRGGGNFFSYDSNSYTNDGITYKGTLQLRSGEALLDWFPFGGGFHLSPGVQFYNGFKGSANLNVPGSTSFTLNNTSYSSSAALPVTGSATLSANQVAPMFLFGFGNLVPRTKHFSVLGEFGFAYQGTVKVGLAFSGNACNPALVNGVQVNCRSVATDAGIQANIAGQQKIISDDIDPYAKFYPIIRLGFGYKF